MHLILTVNCGWHDESWLLHTRGGAATCCIRWREFSLSGFLWSVDFHGLICVQVIQMCHAPHWQSRLSVETLLITIFRMMDTHWLNDSNYAWHLDAFDFDCKLWLTWWVLIVTHSWRGSNMLHPMAWILLADFSDQLIFTVIFCVQVIQMCHAPHWQSRLSVETLLITIFRMMDTHWLNDSNYAWHLDTFDFDCKLWLTWWVLIVTHSWRGSNMLHPMAWILLADFSDQLIFTVIFCVQVIQMCHAPHWQSRLSVETLLITIFRMMDKHWQLTDDFEVPTTKICWYSIRYSKS